MKSISIISMSLVLASALTWSCSNTELAGQNQRANKADVQRASGKDGGSDDSGNDPNSGDGGGTDDGGGKGDGGWDNAFISGDGDSSDGGVDGGADHSDGGTDSTDTVAGGLIVDEGNASAHRVPSFGLLVNDLRCGLCHVRVTGDVMSTSDVMAFSASSMAEFSGTWSAAGAFNGNVAAGACPNGAGCSVSVKGWGGKPFVSKVKSPTAKGMPADLNNDGKPDFPELDVPSFESEMAGRMTGKDSEGKAIDIKKVFNGNLVVLGTDEAPIKIVGEVLIKGDLVIKGTYQGIGNIYATGNVYIPGDLKGKTSPFPYPIDPEAARTKAKESIKNKDDALAIATSKSIIISDFETHPAVGEQKNRSVFEREDTPAEDKAAELGVNDVFNWFPNGRQGFATLYDTWNAGCKHPTVPIPNNKRSFSRIDAFLYAQKAIGGRANQNSYSINGGVIANHFHIISAAGHCAAGVHPVHKQDQQWSYVNYDWRMQTGLLLLKRLGRYFPEK